MHCAVMVDYEYFLFHCQVRHWATYSHRQHLAAAAVENVISAFCAAVLLLLRKLRYDEIYGFCVSKKLNKYLACLILCQDKAGRIKLNKYLK